MSSQISWIKSKSINLHKFSNILEGSGLLQKALMVIVDLPKLFFSKKILNEIFHSGII